VTRVNVIELKTQDVLPRVIVENGRVAVPSEGVRDVRCGDRDQNPIKATDGFMKPLSLGLGEEVSMLHESLELLEESLELGLS
jgi:hypothetical protein